MKFLFRMVLLALPALFFSCTSLGKAPEEHESRFLLFVAEFHKPIMAPTAELHLDGMEDALRFALRAPIAAFTLPAGETHTIRRIELENVDTSSFSAVEFQAPGGRVSLLPLKAVIVNKSRIEFEPLNNLDIAYVKGQLQKNRRYSEIPVIYPAISE